MKTDEVVDGDEPDMSGLFGEIYDAPDPSDEGDGAGEDAPKGKAEKPDDAAEPDEADDSVDPDGADLAPDEAEEEDDSDPEDDDEKDKLKLPEKFRARLDKLVAQRNKVREELTAAQGRLKTAEERLASAEAEPVMLAPTEDSPLSNVRNAAELEAAESYWQNLLDWAEDNDAGGTLKGPNGTEQELDRDAVKRLRRTARTMLEKAVPERRAFLEKRPEVLKKAKAAYPFLQNPNHKGAKYAAELVQRTGLAHRADYELIAGDAYIGALVRTGAANVVRDSKTGEVRIVPRGTAAPAPKKATAPVTPPVRTRAGTPPLREASRDAARREEILQNGTPEDLAAMAFKDIL